MEPIKEIKASLKRALQENIDHLINEIFNLVNPDTILHDDMIIIAGRYKQLMRDISRGTLDQELKEKSLAQIRSGLLKVINDLEEKDLAFMQPSGTPTSLIQMNEAFRELFQKYQDTKKWIEENFGEFDHSFLRKEFQTKEDSDEYEFIESTWKNSNCRIFGSNLKLNFAEREKIKFKALSAEEKGFIKEEKRVCQYILDILDLEKLLVSEEFRNGEYGSNLYSVPLTSKNGLNKIFANEFTEEAVMIFHDSPNDREDLDYKGLIGDYKENSVTLFSTNSKFLEAFCKKMNEFLEICRRLNSGL